MTRGEIDGGKIDGGEIGAEEAGLDAPVAICIVTYDAAADLPACLRAVQRQTHRPLELILVDCASRDGSARLASELATPGIAKKVIALETNLGFSGGMNRALGETRAPWVLSLNADAIPEEDFVQQLVRRGSADSRTGAVTGRLVRPEEAGQRRIDACGMVLTSNWRHLDRGSGAIDRGQWNQSEEVFGATGAASLFRRVALEDVAHPGGEIFDVDFFAYREDAELAFRLQERGWKVVYEPAAVCEHRRRVVPERRGELPAVINYHSLKNRYLLRAYHQTSENFWRTLIPTLFRDLLAIGYVVLRERTSLPAYSWLWRHRRRILERRRWVQGRKTRPAHEIDSWFGCGSKPL